MDEALELLRTVDLGAVESDDNIVLQQAGPTGGTVLVDIGDARSGVTPVICTPR
jgi:hypothetical protein